MQQMVAPGPNSSKVTLRGSEPTQSDNMSQQPGQLCQKACCVTFTAQTEFGNTNCYGFDVCFWGNGGSESQRLPKSGPCICLLRPNYPLLSGTPV